MGGGALEPKTVARVSKDVFYKKKKKAFTLAEILITLAIIGVVAALTIPTVVAKYQQKAQYTAFMKMYNTVVNALDLAIAENGLPETWAIDRDNEQEVTNQYLAPYLKITKTCDTSDLLSCASSELYDLHGEKMDINDVYVSNILTLADGSSLSVVYSGDNKRYNKWEILGINFVFDTNGKKGPNVLGRDIFLLGYMLDYDDINKWSWEYYYVNSGEVDGYGNSIDSCNPNVSSEFNGRGCAGRLLEEGKMDY